jgi:alkanesulfonate monooxygenase SsuD/methylene tetrahydromethanopterin reductase-like flavin-dependent oxidoreductase (luciferase family)
MTSPALGFVVRPEHTPEELPALAAAVEAAGFDELWLWEDCFFAGAIAAAGAALAATARIRVGLGIMPAPVRNPAFAAMEIAALARLYPGRLLPGFGHGATSWMRQIGAKPASQLDLLEETLGAVRALLAGEEVHADGRYVHLDGVRLDHPPDEVPPVYTGVRRARSLAVSGRAADGTVLAELSSIEYVRWAREQIAATRPHRLVVFAWCSLDADADVAREPLRPLLADRLADGGPQVEQAGVDLASLDGGAIPDEWIDRLTVGGTPEQAARAIRALAGAGADAVVLVPPASGADPAALARPLLPLLRD